MPDYITNKDMIIFSPEWNNPLDIKLLSNYEKLIFSDYVLNNDLFDKSKSWILVFKKSKFNQEVNNLPNSITHLTFNYQFNQEVNNLPNSITHLTFGRHFNKKIDIPFTIKYLKLYCNNSYIIDYLPDNIEELELGDYFNLELNNLLTSIKKITFDKYNQYKHELNCLPKFLECLQLPCLYDKKILNISDNLKIICSKNYKYKNDYINQVEVY